MTEPEFATVAEAAEELGRPVSALYRWIDEKRLTTARGPRSVTLVSLSDARQVSAQRPAATPSRKRRFNSPKRDEADALKALSAALTLRVPACIGDKRFIADPGTLPARDRTEMQAMCATCSLSEPCDEYGRSAMPAAGWWAGKHYTSAASTA